MNEQAYRSGRYAASRKFMEPWDVTAEQAAEMYESWETKATPYRDANPADDYIPSFLAGWQSVDN